MKSSDRLYAVGTAAIIIVVAVAWMKPWKPNHDPVWDHLIQKNGPDYEVLYRVLTIGEPSKVQQVNREDFMFVVNATSHKNERVQAGAFDALAFLSRNPRFQDEAWQKIRGLKGAKNQNLAKKYWWTAMKARLPEIKGELIAFQSSQDPQVAAEASRLISIGKEAKWIE